jgi:hypothetical protein
MSALGATRPSSILHDPHLESHQVILLNTLPEDRQDKPLNAGPAPTSRRPGVAAVSETRCVGIRRTVDDGKVLQGSRVRVRASDKQHHSETFFYGLSNDDSLRFYSLHPTSSRSLEDPGVNEYNSRLRNKRQGALLLQFLGETSISLTRKVEFLVWLLTSMVSRVRFPAQSRSRSTSLRKDRGFLCLFFLQVCFGFGERSSNNGSEESRGGRHGTNRDEAAAD